VRFCLFIRFFAQDHLLTIYEIAAFPPSKFSIVFATFSCMESAAILQPPFCFWQLKHYHKPFSTAG